MKFNKKIKNLILSSLLCFNSIAIAEGYPNKTITIVVPVQAGGAVDNISRIISKHLSDELNQPVIIENKPGASNMIGANHVARSPADGYTLLMMSTSLIIQDIYNKNHKNSNLLSFDEAGMIGFQPMVISVSNNLPVNNLRDLANLAKTKDGLLNYATFGNGTTPHLVCELASMELGIRLNPIAYKGAPAALTDLMAGRIDSFCDVPATSAPLHESKKIKVLGVMDKKRSALLPEVPTFAELGYPNVNTGVIYGLLAPKGTAEDILQILNNAIVKVLNKEEVVVSLKKIGVDTVVGSRSDFSKKINEEKIKWKSVIENRRITLD